MADLSLAMPPEQIITEHGKLVYSIANSYRKKGVELDDLVQEGYIGLLEAAKHYDSTLNVKFSTYAVYWIKKYIIKAVESACAEQDKKVTLKNSVSARAAEAQSRHPKPDSANKALQLPPDMPLLEQQIITYSCSDCLTIKEISAKTGLTTERVRQVRQKALRRCRKAKQAFSNHK